MGFRREPQPPMPTVMPSCTSAAISSMVTRLSGTTCNSILTGCQEVSAPLISMKVLINGYIRPSDAARDECIPERMPRTGVGVAKERVAPGIYKVEKVVYDLRVECSVETGGYDPTMSHACSMTTGPAIW